MLYEGVAAQCGEEAAACLRNRRLLEASDFLHGQNIDKCQHHPSSLNWYHATTFNVGVHYTLHYSKSVVVYIVGLD